VQHIEAACSKEEVLKKILRFFNAYDASRDLNIIVLKKRLAGQKRFNQKLKTLPVFDYAEKIEMENLFLSCISVNKHQA
jgi:hypothetical protein